MKRKDLKKDLEYRDILFTGCTDFTTPEDLFGILARRFNDVEDTGRHPEDKVAIQYKYVPFDLKQFCH